MPHSQTSMLTTPELAGPLEQLILPLLGADSLASLACANTQLRKRVQAASLATWQCAATSVLPPRHPGLRSENITSIHTSLLEFKAAQRRLANGTTTMREQFTDMVRPSFSPTGDNVVMQEEGNPANFVLVPVRSSTVITGCPRVTLPGRIVGYEWHADGQSISVLHRTPGTPGLSIVKVGQGALTVASTVRIDDRAMQMGAGFFWSPCATMIVLRSTADRSHTAVIEIATGTVIMTSTGGWLEAVWAPDSSAIAFQHAYRDESQKPVVTIIAVPSGRLLLEAVSDNAQYPVAFSPDARLLALRNAGTSHIDIVDASTGALVCAFNGMAELAWSLDGQLVMGPDADAEDGLLVVNAATGQHVGAICLSGKCAFETSRAWSPSSKLIGVCSGCEDSLIFSVYEAASCRLVCSHDLAWQAHPGHFAGVVEWHNDGSKVIVHTPKGQSIVHLLSFASEQ